MTLFSLILIGPLSVVRLLYSCCSEITAVQL
jgi:hypothetical protein